MSTGEKLYPASSEGGLTDDEVGANSASETDESMTHIALSTIDEDSSVTSDAIGMVIDAILYV